MRRRDVGAGHAARRPRPRTSPSPTPASSSGTGQVIESGTIIVRGGTIASVTPGARAHAGAARDRRQGAVGDAGVHRQPQARQRRPRRQGADAVAARGRLHDDPLRRQQRRRRRRPARQDREGRVQRPAHHPVGAHPAAADAGRSARRRAGDGGEGHQAHRRDRPHAGAGAAAGGDRGAQGHRGRGEEGGRAGERARRQHAGDGGGGGGRRDAPGAPAEQGLDRLRGGRRGGEDRLDRRRPDRVRRADHRPRVAGAGGRAVPARQHHPLPRRQAVAGSDCRRQPRSEGPRHGHRGAATPSSTRAASGTRTPTTRRWRTPPTRTSPTSPCWSTS